MAGAKQDELLGDNTNVSLTERTCLPAIIYKPVIIASKDKLSTKKPMNDPNNESNLRSLHESDSHHASSFDLSDADISRHNHYANSKDNDRVQIVFRSDEYSENILDPVSPTAQSPHRKMFRYEFSIYEKDSGLIVEDDAPNHQFNNASNKRRKCVPKHETTAQRLKRWRTEATTTFVSTALGASLARAFQTFQTQSGQFAMNVRQAMRRSLVVKGFMHPNAVAVRTIHVHIGLVVFICVFELVIGAISIYRFIRKRKRRRFGYIATGLVLLVGRQLITICFALVGGALGQLILFGAPVAGAILGALIGAAIGQIVGWVLSRILKKFLPRIIRHCARQFGFLPDTAEEGYNHTVLLDDSSSYTRHRPYECCPLSAFTIPTKNIIR